MKFNTQFFRLLALSGYILLFAWVIIWHFVLTQTSTQSVLFTTLLWIVPLLFPMRGMIKGTPYTHAWANFIVMIYLLHGLTAIYAVSTEWFYALLEIIFATMMFIGCSFYARMRGKELGLGIKKLKVEMAEEKSRFEE